MIPKAPPRSGQVGFLYLPPFRIQGVSIAGEQTMVQIPELDVAFDIGLCPKIALTSPYIALSHGHMDHVAGLPYYFSQRMFQKIGKGKVVCHEEIAGPLQRMMASWVDLEQQQTEHEIIPLKPDDQIEIKKNIFLRAVEVSHTVPALGYSIIEYRSKLNSEYIGMPQEHLRDLKKQGKEITHTLQIPLIAYTGDTQMGPFLFRDEFAKAQIVVCECTFFEDDHQQRAKIGKHIHVEDLVGLLDIWEAQAVVLVHLSRRTNMQTARQVLDSVVGPKQASRVHFLMDHRANRLRYEQQAECVNT